MVDTSTAGAACVKAWNPEPFSYVQKALVEHSASAAFDVD
jgi:hypothetical protein